MFCLFSVLQLHSFQIWDQYTKVQGLSVNDLLLAKSKSDFFFLITASILMSQITLESLSAVQL